MKARNTGTVHIYSNGLLTPMATASIRTMFETLKDFKFLKAIMLDPYVGELLKTPSPFTLFAPTDKAFERMSPSARAKLLSDSKAMVSLVKRQIAAESFYTNFMEARLTNHVIIMLSGEKATLVKSRDDGIQINDDVSVISPYDVTTANGVVHAVDKFL